MSTKGFYGRPSSGKMYRAWIDFAGFWWQCQNASVSRLFEARLQGKVPNTEQPFACLDLKFLATLVDQLLGFKQGSILHSSNNVNGMNTDWPLAAAFYVYQNGL